MGCVSNAAMDKMLKMGQFRLGVGVSTSSSPLPALILSASGLGGITGTIYTTTPGAVVKFAHRNDKSQRSLVREADAYRTLVEQHVASVPI